MSNSQATMTAAAALLVALAQRIRDASGDVVILDAIADDLEVQSQSLAAAAVMPIDNG